MTCAVCGRRFMAINVRRGTGPLEHEMVAACIARRAFAAAKNVGGQSAIGLMHGCGRSRYGASNDEGFPACVLPSRSLASMSQLVMSGAILGRFYEL